MTLTEWADDTYTDDGQTVHHKNYGTDADLYVRASENRFDAEFITGPISDPADMIVFENVATEDEAVSRARYFLWGLDNWEV